MPLGFLISGFFGFLVSGRLVSAMKIFDVGDQSITEL
jgi:hypothetical protein